MNTQSHNPHRPGIKEKLFFLFSGIVVSAPFPFLVTSLVSYALLRDLPQFWALFLAVAFIGPLVEEFAKAYPLFFRHGETEKSLMTLGFLTGLGFGITEFFFYVLMLHAPIPLRLPGVLFHATNTTIIAYGIAKNKSFPFYLLTVALHFSYNFFVLLGQFWVMGAFIALLGSYFLAWFFSVQAREKTVGQEIYFPRTAAD